MSYWNSPTSLQKISSTVVAKCLFQKLSFEAKDLEKLFISNLINEEEFVASVQKQLKEIEQWWDSIPGTPGKLGNTFQASLDNVTELRPNVNWDAMDHISSLLLKVVLLDSVFIDKDYSNNYGLCMVPFAYENITNSILKGRLFKFKKLFIYGAMYPSISETLISNSTSLKYLAISQLNLTDELMDCIAMCSELEVLHLLHNYIWMAVSIPALCRGFFNVVSEEFVSTGYHSERSILLSFTNLKEVDIGSCTSKFIIPFYKWLLYFYDIQETYSCWKTCVFEEDRKYSTEKIILPVIRKGKILRLKYLYLNVGFLSSLTNENMNLITNFMPDICHLCVDCQVNSNYKDKDKMSGKKLRILATKFRSMTKLSANISSENRQTLNVLSPYLHEFGATLTNLTITSEYQEQKIKIENLQNILNFCPNIVSLKLLFLNSSSITYEENLENFRFHSTKLTEFWLHELSPWDVRQEQSNEAQAKNWEILLNCVLQSSPHLQILSITICQTLFQFLRRLKTRVSCFHLHVKDGCEWSINETILTQMIKRFPNLKYLYLEELDGDTFWKIKTRFQRTKLNIFWGNFGGWPKT